MKSLLPGILIFAILSCANHKSKTETNSSTNIVHLSENYQLDTLIFGKRLIIKDTTSYSPYFIKGLKSSYQTYETLKVADDSLFITYRINTKPEKLITDQYAIPTNLELNKDITFSASLRGDPFTLILKRTNYTDIDYQLRQREKTIKSGTVRLQSSFYFGAECQNDENGKSMYLRQYLDSSRWGTIVKVEMEHAQKATISYCINGKGAKQEELPVFSRE